MEKETAIFCAAYVQIYNALYVAWNYYQKQPVTLVIYDNPDIFKFFKEINEKVFHDAIKIINIEPYRPGALNVSGIGKPFGILLNTIKERLYLKKAFNRYLAGLKDADIYFFRRYFCGGEYYWLHALARSNKLFFMPSPVYDTLGIKRATHSGVKELLYLIRWKLAYGSGIALSRHPLGLLVPYIPDKFIKRHVAGTIEGEEREKLLRNLDVKAFRVFGGDNYDVMYFHDDLVGGGYVTDEAAFHKALTDIFAVLRRYIPEDRIASKLHPKSEDRETMPQFGVILPDYIPAEFLYNDNVKMYIGLSSMAIANVEKGTVVSLIDIAPFKDDYTRQGLKEIMIRASKTEMLFPASLSEFEQILKKLVETDIS